MSVSLAEIRIYPVKSCAALCPAEAVVEPWGLQGDRRWMLVDRSGRFISQRSHPAMARLRPGGCGTRLHIDLPQAGRLTVALPSKSAPKLSVTVWQDSMPARDAGDQAADWCSAALGLPCRLVFLDDPSARPLKPQHAANDAECVSFADGFPLLLTSVSSLSDLNARLADPVPMARFRPNVVVTGVPPWAEDGWRRIRIGEALFRVPKPCERCPITTIDQDTGARPDPAEPLRTLAAFRRSEEWNGVLFGMNLVPERCGTLRLGDEVEIIA